MALTLKGVKINMFTKKILRSLTLQFIFAACVVPVCIRTSVSVQSFVIFALSWGGRCSY